VPAAFQYLVELHRVVALVVLVAHDQDDVFLVPSFFQSLVEFSTIHYALWLIPV
jgi:hypothetical protein